MIPYKSIESVEGIESPVSTEMINALDLWYNLYTDTPPWRNPDTGIISIGLPAFICTEIARQITLDAKFNITGTKDDSGEITANPRAEYLAEEFKKLAADLRRKLEVGCAAGGMIIKPYVRGEHLFFDFAPDWSVYPLAFDDDGKLSDVVFQDRYTEGKTFYTRLERHQINGDSVTVTQRAFRSTVRDSIGSEVPLTEVKPWAELVPEAVVESAGGPLFGWFRVAAANNVDTESPFGVSVYARACGLIRDADEQYSRMKWEFEGSELAVDVDNNVLKRRKDGTNGLTMPRLKERLFRGVDLGKDDNYSVFSPPIRDESLINGFNRILMRIEDNCGLARGMISDVNTEARTATELVTNKQRYYATVSDNQAALEACLRDVIRVMDPLRLPLRSRA